MRRPVKLREVTARLPTAGRIRAGKQVETRSGKMAPTKLSTFRFTSQDQASIERVAQLYGGQVEPWSHPLAAKGQWQVETEATEIEVALPPDPLGESWYELWTAAGCERRCDGETVTLARGAGPDGAEPVEQDCLCLARGELACKRTTRLSVLLPDVRFLGCWRLDTKGENAAEELPGMVAMVQAMQGRGITKAVLRLDQRRSGNREFVVPVLGLDATVNELAAGDARLGLQDGSAPTPVLEAASEDRAWPHGAACPGCKSPYALHLADCPERAFDDSEVIDVVEIDQRVDTGGSAVIGEDVLFRRPIDEALTKAWLESLSNAQKAKALLVARKIAQEREWPAPTMFEEIGLELADLTEEAMRKDET